MDHELSETEMSEIKLHLQNWPECRALLSRLKETTDLLLTMPEIEPSSEFDIRFQEKLAATTAPGKVLVKRIQPWTTMGRRISTMLFSTWRPYAIGAAAMGILAAFIFLKTGDALTPDEVLLTENLEILQEYEILTDLDFFEYLDIVENRNSKS